MNLEELEQELLQLPAEDRSRLSYVLWDSLDPEEERERYYNEHLLPFLQRYPLNYALAELRATLSGLPLNDRSRLIDALGRDLVLAWDEEIQRRMDAHDRGEVELIDADVGLSRVRARLADASRSDGPEAPAREITPAGSAEGKRRYEAHLRGEIEAYPLDDALNELRSKLLP